MQPLSNRKVLKRRRRKLDAEFKPLVVRPLIPGGKWLTIGRLLCWTVEVWEVERPRRLT